MGLCLITITSVLGWNPVSIFPELYLVRNNVDFQDACIACRDLLVSCLRIHL